MVYFYAKIREIIMICNISILHEFTCQGEGATALADKRILIPRLHTAIPPLPAGGGTCLRVPYLALMAYCCGTLPRRTAMWT